ncbi:XRE family transcriptional regulator [bacterium SCN 62-11]|nr:MAG: XRE family transcriptional regulator [bacterium SCN 62-11]
MTKASVTLFPKVAARLKVLGENLRLARLRRRITSLQLAQRAGISRPTLSKLENGDPGVSLAAFANVMFCLGLDSDLEAMALDDALGRRLMDADLSLRKRAPKLPKPRG